MSTNSTITVRTKENERKEIYCHWDGYPEGVGNLLLKYYNTFEKAKELVELGNLSFLGSKIQSYEEPHQNWEKPIYDVCMYYDRDRGESNQEPRILKNVDETDRQEYNYYFDGNEWYVNNKLLSEILSEILFE